MGKALAVIGTVLVAVLAVVVVGYQAGRGGVSSLPAGEAAAVSDPRPTAPPARVADEADTGARATVTRPAGTERKTGSIPKGLPDDSEGRPTGASLAGARTGRPSKAGTSANASKAIARTSKPDPKPRTADARALAVWLRADQVRLTTPRLADGAFRTRLARTLRGMEGVRAVKVGGSPIGKSLFIAYDPEETSPPPIVERASELLAEDLGGDGVELAFVGRDGREVPVGCGCG
ncbi:MAG: hypothetical protein M3P51_09375, partial [Chloroflexota bacterium]|nr:hypothetical protein [Chloroflexota bacterium]